MSDGQLDSIDRDRLASFFGVVIRKRSYKNILYLLLSFVLGYLYFALYTFVFVFGLVFAIMGVGLAILFGAFVASRHVAAFERGLANSLLGTDIEGPPDVDTGEGIRGTVVAYATDHPTWRGLGFLALKFWLGLLSFLLVFVGFVVSLALLVPVGESEVLGWTIDSTAESILVMPLGFVLLFVVFHLCNAAASLSGSVAAALLDEGTPTRDDAVGGDGRRSDAGVDTADADGTGEDTHAVRDGS